MQIVMYRAMEKTRSYYVRCLTLGVVIANIVFNGVYAQLFKGPDIQQVSRSFHDLFTPAGYVFSIWGLIYLSFMIYGVVSLMPSQRRDTVYDRLSIPLMLANVFGSLWIMAFTHRQFVISLIILLIMLALSIVMFLRVNDSTIKEDFNRWILVPFSLFFGWISVATIAGTAVTLISLGYDGGSFGVEQWTIAMIVVAAVLAIIVESRFNNYLFPLVIVWASIGIWDERQMDHPTVAIVALISSMVILLFVIGHAIARYLRA
ncbi:tryptophan-rich sensory protein [soil metagenome]